MYKFLYFLAFNFENINTQTKKSISQESLSKCSVYTLVQRLKHTKHRWKNFKKFNEFISLIK